MFIIICRYKLFQGVDIFDNVLFYRRECLVAYVVLELACVLDRDFFADTEADQQIREHGVPLVYLMRDLKPRIGECEISVLVHEEIAALLEKSNGAADARL